MSYQYDARNRLAATCGGTNPLCPYGFINTYVYDGNGNRKQSADASAAPVAVDGQDRLISYGNYGDLGAAASFTYTNGGDLASKTINGATTVYNYDLFGNLRSVTLPRRRSFRAARPSLTQSTVATIVRCSPAIC